MNVLFNCLEATRLISKSQHVKLSFSEDLSIKVHVAMCKYCKSFQRDLDFVKTELEKNRYSSTSISKRKLQKEAC